MNSALYVRMLDQERVRARASTRVGELFAQHFGPRPEDRKLTWIYDEQRRHAYRYAIGRCLPGILEGNLVQPAPTAAQRQQGLTGPLLADIHRAVQQALVDEVHEIRRAVAYFEEHHPLAENLPGDPQDTPPRDTPALREIFGA